MHHIKMVCLYLASNGKKKSEKTYGSSANPLAYIPGCECLQGSS
nr:MAG TPA: hypothetical protein [Bacteriophage sp.]